MDITVYSDGFVLGAFCDLAHESNNDGSLTVWGRKDARPIIITAPSGVFVQALNEAGDVIVEGGDGNYLYVPLDKKKITVRRKVLPDLDFTKSGLDCKRQKVTRCLVSDMPYSLKIPDTLAGAIKWMQKRLAEIPDGSRKHARVDFDTKTRYGETYPNCEITYSEPETDEELIHRLQVERERARIQKAKERSELGRLQKKYATA